MITAEMREVIEGYHLQPVRYKKSGQDVCKFLFGRIVSLTERKE